MPRPPEPLADVAEIEVRGQALKCPRCRRWRRALLVLGGGRVACLFCAAQERQQRRV